MCVCVLEVRGVIGRAGFWNFQCNEKFVVYVWMTGLFEINIVVKGFTCLLEFCRIFM